MISTVKYSNQMNSEMMEADTAVSQYYYAKENHRRIKYQHESKPARIVNQPQSLIQHMDSDQENIEPVEKKNTRESRKNIVEPIQEKVQVSDSPAVVHCEIPIKPFRIPKGRYQKRQHVVTENTTSSTVMKISKKRKMKELYAESRPKDICAVNRHVDHILNTLFDEHLEYHNFKNPGAEIIKNYRKWWISNSIAVRDLIEHFLGSQL
jgi:hypothetical protein